jgi:hypothetical protein
MFHPKKKKRKRPRALPKTSTYYSLVLFPAVLCVCEPEPIQQFNNPTSSPKSKAPIIPKTLFITRSTKQAGFLSFFRL